LSKANVDKGVVMKSVLKWSP